MDIDDILAEMGMDRRSVRIWARRSDFDGRPATCHVEPPRREHPDYTLASGDIVKVTKFSQFPEIGAIIIERFNRVDNKTPEVYKMLAVEDGREIFSRRDGLVLMCRAGDIDNADFSSFGFLTKDESLAKYAPIREQLQIKISFAIEMEKLLWPSNQST